MTASPSYIQCKARFLSALKCLFLALSASEKVARLAAETSCKSALVAEGSDRRKVLLGVKWPTNGSFRHASAIQPVSLLI